MKSCGWGVTGAAVGVAPLAKSVEGVTVAHTMEEAEAALRGIMIGQVFGACGTLVVIEEFLAGQEMSILSFADGER